MSLPVPPSLVCQIHFTCDLSPFESHLRADFASPAPAPLNLLSNLPMLNLHLTYQENLQCVPIFSSLNHLTDFYLLCVQVTTASAGG